MALSEDCEVPEPVFALRPARQLISNLLIVQ